MTHLIVLGQPLLHWVIALSVTIGGAIVLSVTRDIIGGFLSRRAPQTKGQTDDLVAELVRGTHTLFLVALSASVGIRFLTLSPAVSHVANLATATILVLQVALWANALVGFFRGLYVERHRDDPSIVTSIQALAIVAHIIVWAGLILVILGTFGLNISALVAGLGVGSLAVALALQTLLADLLASITITLDKPFRIGDYIVFGNYSGTVEYIGLRSSRIRALSGELIVTPNAQLTTRDILNYTRMQERRIVTQIGIEYGTPFEKVEAVPAWIREIVEKEAQVRFDRAHFQAYGAYSLDFQVVYWIKSPDYTVYMDCQQAINLAIGRRFEQEGVVFAFPTQTLFQPSVDELAKRMGQGGGRDDTPRDTLPD